MNSIVLLCLVLVPFIAAQPSGFIPSLARNLAAIADVEERLVPAEANNGRRYARVATGERFEPIDPYNFAYDATDEYGNKHYRDETSDGQGTVRGTYGYTDARGLYRVVEYVADASGFRAKVKTNEPGTRNRAPADVEVEAQAPPEDILRESYGPRSARS